MTGFLINSFIFTSLLATFASLYESFQALTSIQTSHFVEWFSGKALDSIWTNVTTAGSGLTVAMNDAVDGGIILSGAVASEGSLWFNDINHYSPTASTVIFVTKILTNLQDGGIGLSANTELFSGESSAMRIHSGSTFYGMLSGDASTTTVVVSDISVDTNFHTGKIENGSSNLKLTIDGVLKVTKTTNRPTVAMQPIVNYSSGDGAGTSVITYFESFNTTVSILSSLYERLSALTQIAGQRVVETFSGNVLNERWNEETGTGAVTYGMNDAVDGGFKITTAASSNSRGQITFNNKRQYDETNSVCILVSKKTTASSIRTWNGLSDTLDLGLSNGNQAIVVHSTDATFIELSTSNAGTRSVTASDIARDEIYHVFKTECSSANIKLTIDGVLKVTKTTDRPAAPMQPYMYVQTLASSVVIGQILYCEAYNKLTTETDYPSVYELFNPLTTIAKQHFWEWFDGNNLSNRWQIQFASGATGAMNDAADGGYRITTDAINNSIGWATFNSKRQFKHDASEVICVFRPNDSDAAQTECGLRTSNLTPATNNNNRDSASVANQTSGAFIGLVTGDASTVSQDASDISTGTVYHSFKMVLASDDIRLFIDGVLKITKTSNRPTVKLQPAFWIRTGGAVVKSADYLYYEAYNT